MSDARRREMERAAAGGDPEAAGRLLLDRVRTGELPEARVRILAILGDPAAGLALGVSAVADPERLARAAAGLGWPRVARGLTAAARAALGDERVSRLQRAAGLALQRLEQAQASGERPALETACRAVEAMNSILQMESAAQSGPTEAIARAVEAIVALLNNLAGVSGRLPLGGDVEGGRTQLAATVMTALLAAGLPVDRLSAALVAAAEAP